MLIRIGRCEPERAWLVGSQASRLVMRRLLDDGAVWESRVAGVDRDDIA